MMKQLSKLYTEDQNRRITAALGNKPEPADLTPRFLLALNERNLEKVGDHLSEDVRHVINQVIDVLNQWLNGVVTLDHARASLAAFYAVLDADAACAAAKNSADIGNREDELNWQVNKLIELIGGEA